MRWALLQFFLPLFACYPCTNAEAFELRSGVKAMTLYGESYRHLGYQLGATLGGGPQAFSVNAGISHPFRHAGISQLIGSADVGIEWRTISGVLRPWAGVGAGFYVDAVGRSRSIIPAVVPRLGVKVGSQTLGVHFELSSSIGIYNPTQFLGMIAWTISHSIVGLYVNL